MRAHLDSVRQMDLWIIHLPGAGPSIDLSGLATLLGEVELPRLVNWLVQLREVLGRLFDLERPHKQPDSSWLSKLSPEEIETAPIRPGTRLGPATILWNNPREAVLEVLNQTCQAFVYLHLTADRLYLSVYVIRAR